MQKALFKTLRLSALYFMLAMLLVPLRASARSYLTENFAYDTGNLYGQGGWLRNGKQAISPIQVINEPLTYPGY